MHIGFEESKHGRWTEKNRLKKHNPSKDGKSKCISKTNVPQYAVERFALCVFDDIRAVWMKAEVPADLQQWLA